MAFPGETLRLRDSWNFFLAADTRANLFEWGELARFGRNVADSAWLYVGWLRYPAPSTWWRLVHGVWIAGLLGAAVFI